jgi:ascorbate-specific PTS system EIIC-type component UlaA
VLIGFLFSFLGGLVGLFICGQFSWVLILPGVVPHFLPARRRACSVTLPADVAGR